MSEETQENVGLQIVVPEVPQTINVYGVEINNDKLRKEVAEIKGMKIDGITDKAGYDLAKEKLTIIRKLRTNSEKWRKETTAPMLKFQKDLKAVVDTTGEICKEAETHLETIIKPIDDYVEEQRLAAEKAKDALAETRAQEIVSVGGLYDGKGTYNFGFDAALFVLQDSLRDLTDEEYEEMMQPIRAGWNAEQEKDAQAKQAQQAEAEAGKQALQILKDKTIKFRTKELIFEDFEEKAPGVWKKENITVTQEQLENLSDDNWEALLAGKLSNEAVGEAPVEGTPAANTSAFNSVSDFMTDEDEPAVEQNPIAEVEQEEATSEERNSVYSRKFTEASPFIELAIGKNFLMRYYTAEFEYEANSDIDPQTIAQSGTLDGNLIYILIKKG